MFKTLIFNIQTYLHFLSSHLYSFFLSKICHSFPLLLAFTQYIATWHYSTTFIFFIILHYIFILLSYFSHSFIYEEIRYIGLLHKPNSGRLTENRTHSQLFIRLVYMYFTHLVIFMMYVKVMRPSGKIYSLFTEINLCLSVWHCK